MELALATSRRTDASSEGSFARRLWLGACAMLVCIGTIAASECVSRLGKSDSPLAFGYDLLPSYVAGRLVRGGHADRLYDSPAFGRAEAEIISEARLDVDARYAPWLNPPFYAWTFAPISLLPYRQAMYVWLALNLLFLGGSIVLLCRMLPRNAGWQVWGLVPVCIAATTPAWEVACSLQNTFLSLMLLCAVVTLWRRGAGFFAGSIAGLLFYKPQLAAIVAVVLVASLGRRAFAGLLVTGTALLLINLCTLPGTLPAYLHALAPITRHLQEQSPYNWGRQATLLGFWRLALNGHYIGATRRPAIVLWLAGSLILLACLALAVWKNRVASRRDQLIVATIATMPLLMPYFMEYDLLLLAAPAVLWANQSSVLARWTRRAWIALGLGIAVNPMIAGATRFNLAVPLLVVVAGLSLWRCLRREESPVTIQFSQETGLIERGDGDRRADAA